MDKRLLALPLLALAGSTLSGCAAAAIPALAGAGIIGTRIDGKDAGADKDVARGTVEVARPATVSDDPPVFEPAAPAPVKPQPAAALTAVPGPAAPAATPPAMIAVVPDMVPPPPALREARAYPDPANPIATDRYSFARFVRHAQASALAAKGGAGPLSAMLSDPTALDGKRRRCSASEQQIAVIDLDPANGLFAPPANPAKQPGLAIGLAVLREAGVEVAWLSDMSVDLSGDLRSALERSGLDPRGEDIISLRRDATDSKHQRRQNLAGIACIIAIAGDERSDFDERFKYLRNPQAGEGIEPVIGDGWFLIEPLLGE